MTERERVNDNKVQERTAVYDAPGRRTATSPAVVETHHHDADVHTNASRDLVRWGPVLAGLFAALATLVTLSVLGLAIGFAAVDPNAPAGENAQNLGTGAGIWGAISTLIAFFVGGTVAGRAAAVRGNNSGVMNGAMIWFVAIPLLIFAIGSGIGALFGTIGQLATIAAPVATEFIDPATIQPGADGTVPGADAATGATEQVTPQDVAQASAAASEAAWWTLLSLGLAAGAAILGGWLAGRRPPEATPARR